MKSPSMRIEFMAALHLQMKFPHLAHFVAECYLMQDYQSLTEFFTEVETEFPIGWH